VRVGPVEAMSGRVLVPLRDDDSPNRKCTSAGESPEGANPHGSRQRSALSRTAALSTELRGLDGLVELKAPHHDLSTVTTPPADRRKGTVLISCKPNVE
jgi:hypothetical protein